MKGKLMNLNLSNLEQRQVADAMRDIVSALDRHHEYVDDIINLIPAAKFDELRSVRGSIADAYNRLNDLFFGDVRDCDVCADDLPGCHRHDQPEYGPGRVQQAIALVASAHTDRTRADAIVDACDPHGIVRPS